VTVIAEDLSTAHGADVLSDVAAFLEKFVAFPSPEAVTAVTLWAAHTHAIEFFDATPRLALMSAEPASGKTRTLEILELLVARPVMTANCTPAYLIRRVAADEEPPTVLYDEIDTVFGPRARGNEDLRALINAGHRRGTRSGRVAQRADRMELEELGGFAPVALAGLHELPDTIASRAITVRMRKRAPHEKVSPYRRRIHGDEGARHCERLADWVATAGDQLHDFFPVMPVGVDDRAADVWEPLIAVADAAGGDWPVRARVSCVSFVSASRGEGEVGAGIRLLRDLRTVFVGPTMFTETILGLLNDRRPESPVHESGWLTTRAGSWTHHFLRGCFENTTYNRDRYESANRPRRDTAAAISTIPGRGTSRHHLVREMGKQAKQPKHRTRRTKKPSSSSSWRCRGKRSTCRGGIEFRRWEEAAASWAFLRIRLRLDRSGYVCMGVQS
jgi:hypothetical protein